MNEHCSPGSDIQVRNCLAVCLPTVLFILLDQSRPRIQPSLNHTTTFSKIVVMQISFQSIISVGTFHYDRPLGSMGQTPKGCASSCGKRATVCAPLRSHLSSPCRMLKTQNSRFGKVFLFQYIWSKAL